MDAGLEFLGVGELAHHGDLSFATLVSDNRALTALGQNATATLFIEDAAVGLAGLEIRLVSAHHELVGVHQLAAVLNAGVAVEDTILQAQLEIGHRAIGPDQEGVSSNRMIPVSGARDEPFLHGPQVGTPRPAGERLAVEDRNIALGLRIFDGGLAAGESQGGDRQGHSTGAEEGTNRHRRRFPPELAVRSSEAAR